MLSNLRYEIASRRQKFIQVCVPNIMQPGEHVILGMKLVENMEYEAALHHYNKALKKIPDLGFALSNRAMILTKLGRHDEAVKCYDNLDIVEDAKKRMPDGMVYHIGGRYDITADGNHLALMFDTKIRVFEEAGMPEKVIEDCKTLLKLDPASSTARRVMLFAMAQDD